MLGNLSIKTRLLAGFGTVMVMAGLLAVTALMSIHTINGEIETVVNDRWPKTVRANDITDNVNIIARSLRNALLLKDPDEVEKEIQRLGEARKIVGERIENLVKSVHTDKGKELLNAVKEAREAYIAVTQETMTLIKEGRKDAAVAQLIQKVRPVQSAYFKALDQLIRYQGNLMEEAGKNAGSKAKRTTVLILVLIVIATILSLGATFLIVKSISGPLSEGVAVANRLAAGDLTATVTVRSKDEIGTLMTAIDNMVRNLKDLIGKIQYTSANLASGSEELSATAEEISRGMEGQASRSQQIATATEEMSQTVIDVAKNTSDIAQISSQTYGYASDGAGIVNRSVEEVKAIATTVAESSSVMQRLSESSKQIGSIVNVINDIADQTNLLALNAAIEAARAGEQGRGFSVVADEVRKLAEKTTQATSQINAMISSIQTEVVSANAALDNATLRVESGLEFSRKAGDSLDKIVNSSGMLQSMVQQIASATEEMSTVSETISSDIQGNAEGQKEISAGSEQIAQASSGLARLATELKSAAGQFKLSEQSSGV